MVVVEMLGIESEAYLTVPTQYRIPEKRMRADESCRVRNEHQGPRFTTVCSDGVRGLLRVCTITLVSCRRRRTVEDGF